MTQRHSSWRACTVFLLATMGLWVPWSSAVAQPSPCLVNPANGVYQLCLRLSPNRECRQWGEQCGPKILSTQELRDLNASKGCLRFFADGNCQQWSTPPGCVYDAQTFMFRICTAQRDGVCAAVGDRCPGR